MGLPHEQMAQQREIIHRQMRDSLSAGCLTLKRSPGQPLVLVSEQGDELQAYLRLP